MSNPYSVPGDAYPQTMTDPDALTADELLAISSALRSERAESADLLERGFGHARTLDFLDDLIDKVERLVDRA